MEFCKAEAFYVLIKWGDLDCSLAVSQRYHRWHLQNRQWLVQILIIWMECISLHLVEYIEVSPVKVHSSRYLTYDLYKENNYYNSLLGNINTFRFCMRQLHFRILIGRTLKFFHRKRWMRMTRSSNIHLAVLINMIVFCNIESVYKTSHWCSNHRLSIFEIRLNSSPPRNPETSWSSIWHSLAS